MADEMADRPRVFSCLATTARWDSEPYLKSAPRDGETIEIRRIASNRSA